MTSNQKLFWSNPLIGDVRETQKLGNDDVIQIIKSNDPFLSILNLGTSDHSIAQIDAAIEVLFENQSVRHVNLILDYFSYSQLENLAMALCNKKITIDVVSSTSDTFIHFFRCLEQNVSQAISIAICHEFENLLCIQTLAHFLQFHNKNLSFTFYKDSSKLPSSTLKLILGALVSSNHSLKSLTINGSLNFNEMKTLCHALKDFESLSELVIVASNGEALCYLVEFTEGYKSLIDLDIGVDGNLSLAEIDRFSVHLPLAFPLLKRLAMRNLILDSLDEIRGDFHPMNKSWLAVHCLKEFTLSIIQGDEHSVSLFLSRLFHVFQKAERLELEIDENKVDFSKYLTYNENLYSLQVSTNCGTSANFTSLLAGLQVFPNIKQLILRDYVIEDQQIASNLRANEQIFKCMEKVRELCHIVLPSGKSNSDDERVENKIYFECMLRTLDEKRLWEAPLALLPYVLSKLVEGRWFNIVYYIVFTRNDVVIKL